MKPQIITTEKGEELVVLSRADYEALVAAAEAADEDESDVAIYDARKSELGAGRDERLPAEVSAAMLRGDSLLKALRKWRNMTQLDLSEKTRLGQGYISDLEAGRRKGTRETIGVIAKALGVDEAWLAD
jgi:ribosome-binding protein aMBF1 (putative translation factor)